MAPLFVCLPLLLLPAADQDAPALFKRGVTFERFLASAQHQKDLWRTNVSRAQVGPELVARLRKSGADLRFLVITEDACSDSVHVVPYLAALASRAGVELRIVARDAGRPILQAHRTPDGRAATPTVILLRKDREVGAWVERPVMLQRWYLAMSGTLDAGDRQARKVAWYEWDRGDSSLGEIVALAEMSD